MVVLTLEWPSRSQGNSLRQDRRQVGLVENANQRHHLALQRDGQTKDCQKVRELRSRLHCTDVRLGEANQFGERLLTQTALQTNFAKTRSEELPGCRCVSWMSHCLLTKRSHGYMFIRLPTRYPTILETDVIDRIRHIFLQQETTVSGALERELDGIASAHVEELSEALRVRRVDGVAG